MTTTKLLVLYYSMYGHVETMAHGGHETTLTSFHTTLMHQGMVIVGVPYSCRELLNMDEITGGTPYGASTLANADGSCQPSENELIIAQFQGRHVAQITRWLAAGSRDYPAVG